MADDFGLDETTDSATVDIKQRVLEEMLPDDDDDSDDLQFDDALPGDDEELPIERETKKLMKKRASVDKYIITTSYCNRSFYAFLTSAVYFLILTFWSSTFETIHFILIVIVFLPAVLYFLYHILNKP